MRKQGYTNQPAKGKTDRGFYIILAICLVVIAVSSYVLFFAPNNTSTAEVEQKIYLPSNNATTPAPVAVPDVDVPAEPVIQPEPEEEPDERLEEEPAETPKPAEPETKEQTAAEVPAPIWVKPVEGAVLKSYSGDELVKDETMGDWRVHTGTDYAADSGARVYAVCDGTVTRAEVDPLYGGVVVIDLIDGKQAVYQCLAEQLKVSVGDSVRAGDVIGTVGTVGYAESGQDSHLHIEMYANGETINPESVFGPAEQTLSEQEPAVDASQPQNYIDVEE